MDEIALAEKQDRANRAALLLQDDLLQEAFNKLREEYIAAWQITHFKDQDARERLWQAVNVVGLIERHLKKMVEAGKLASRDIAQIKYLKR